ncbi:DUF2147 domain-containing protein [Flavobacterium jejuense]|uniref:DUF2147 domain-containing protein n=1 Tax=Flavobacterium jejuense TaxID=1544455 RepID=A0ABX0IMM7_9FLAO|nr:DUF2147 domain-containing protein [Flavobacterium jejuense]NHN24968.1 DUF2147 domain-containing protein [Flavobacterium jejuense]
MIKKILLGLLLFYTTGDLFAQDSFIGKWETNEGKLCLEIYQEGSFYYGKIKRSEKKDNMNQVVLIQMIKKSATKLYGGTYYDDKQKSEYEAKLKLIDNDTMCLKILSGLFNKIIIWERVSPMP